MLQDRPLITGSYHSGAGTQKPHEKKRFNQAEEFGKRLSHYLEIPMNSSLLIRSKKTVPQKDLGPALRLKNLEQALAAENCRTE